MPELPEVETVKNGLEPVLSGSIIKKVRLNRANLRTPFPDQMVERLQNRRCQNLRRRGKYIWIDLDSNETLVVHLGMSGSFTINPKEVKKHDHVVIETENHKIVYNDPRRFGMMFFVKTGEEHHHQSFSKMGVEPLGNIFHADHLKAKLDNKKTPIKTSLLDQHIVSGVGNIYACEALYMAGINPTQQSCTLTLSQCENLVHAIKQVLKDAIESGGSSLRDHKQTDGTMGYFQHSFKVYGREGQPCPETGDIIKKITQSGRSTFYCPAKQG
jgi:formamidopyrimidine-DNA glycosylase